MIGKVPFRALAQGVLLAALSAQGAAAQDASPWARDRHSALRLLAGSRSGNVLIGGVDIQLNPGWKTYWRTPGDSGVPPRFDFSRSENVESVTALFPAPMSFPDGAGGVSYGYVRRVVLPLRIVPKDATRPVRLRGDIGYAVCEKICVPVEAAVELDVVNAASAQDSGIAAALASLPKPAAVGDAGPLAIRSVHRDGGRAVVEATRPASSEVSLFAEGPTSDWALPQPKPAGRPSPDTVRFVFDLDGLPAGATAEGATLRLTLVGDDGAIEVNAKLD
jgi:DsbC/DsbD-like thiol-disulfide interchange protein